MSKIDLHSHKVRGFDSKQEAERFAFAHHLLAWPHESGPNRWILVFWNEHMGSMCGIISKDSCCALPDW